MLTNMYLISFKLSLEQFQIEISLAHPWLKRHGKVSFCICIILKFFLPTSYSWTNFEYSLNLFRVYDFHFRIFVHPNFWKDTFGHTNYLSKDATERHNCKKPLTKREEYVSAKEQAMLSRVLEQKDCDNGYELPLDVIASIEGQEPKCHHTWLVSYLQKLECLGILDCIPVTVLQHKPIKQC